MENKIIQLIEDGFNSNIFKLCCDYLDVDSKTVFCRAGEYIYCGTFDNRNIRRCYACLFESCVFGGIKRKVDTEPISNKSRINTFVIQYQFITQGFLDGHLIDKIQLSEFASNEYIVKFSEMVKNMLNFNCSKHTKQYSLKEKQRVNRKVKDEYALFD